MEPTESKAESPRRRRRWFQYTLRTLLVGSVFAAVIFSLIGWWLRRPPSTECDWGNNFSEYQGSLSHFFVRAFAIDNREPTIVCFARIDDASRLANPMPWLEYKGDGQVFVQGRLIPHRSGRLDLFVDDGSGQPIEVVLDTADASRYFGHKNTEFTTYREFVTFWEDILRKKYLRGIDRPGMQDRPIVK